MKRFLTLLLLLAVCLSGCNLPARTAATPTASPTLSLTATIAVTETATQPPPASTVPAEPSATAILITQPPPTATQPPPTATQPQATSTPSLPIPDARALFTGTFAGGSFKFRIGDPPNRVIPKSVTIKGAPCKEGGAITTSVSFEPPPAFEIVNARFTISESNTVTISGQFLSESRAGGTIILRLRTKSQTCTIGPLPWIATPGG